MRITVMETDLARLLQRFFCERLIQQQHASARTVSSYRDTFRLLLAFAVQQRQRDISLLCLQDLDAALVLAFLNHLETQRHNAIRTRNARLAAIRAFLQYAALQAPNALATIQSVLAIPMKRFARPLIGYLSHAEIEAILAAPDATSWSGRRDRLLLLLLYNTGARVSELIAIRCADLDLAQRAAVQLHGKGRKERAVPLWQRTAVQVREWLRSPAAARDANAPLPAQDRCSRLPRQPVIRRSCRCLARPRSAARAGQLRIIRDWP